MKATKIGVATALRSGDILVFDPNTGVGAYADCLSGSFTYPSGVSPCSILVNKGTTIRSDACHAWLGFPETVLYRYKDGTFGIGKYKSANEIPNRQNVLWAVGGMGLLSMYNPAEEGFSKFTKNGKAYNYTDVLRDTNHTVLAIKNNECYGLYVPSMTGSEVNAFCKEHKFDMAVMLDGGHIAAINTDDIKINVGQQQGYALQFINAIKKPLVCLDGGHNELTSGKRSPDGTYLEWEHNKDVCERIAKQLERHGIDAVLVEVVKANSKEELNLLVGKINATKADILVSVHSNAFGTGWNDANGWEIFSYGLSGPGYKLAQALRAASIPTLGLTDRGIKDGRNLAVVARTTMPAVLVETAFHTNKKECELLKSYAFRELEAEVYAKGIVAYFGKKWIEPTTSIYRVQVGAFGSRESAEAMKARLEAAGFKAIVV